MQIKKSFRLKLCTRFQVPNVILAMGGQPELCEDRQVFFSRGIIFCFVWGILPYPHRIVNQIRAVILVKGLTLIFCDFSSNQQNIFGQKWDLIEMMIFEIQNG